MNSQSEETRLWNEYLVNRDPGLREQLILRSVALVHFILNRIGFSQERGSEYEDLANQGLLGLIEAVDHFNPSFGTRFSTYAATRIRGKVLDYLRTQDWLPRQARRRTREVQKAVNNLWRECHEEPSDEQIAAYMGLDLPKVQQALVDSSRVFLSLDAATLDSENEEGSFYDMVPDENQENPSDIADENDLKRQLVQHLKELPERERLVLSLYYYEELTLKEIGLVLGITESRVCQLHARAVINLKAMMSYVEDITRSAR